MTLSLFLLLHVFLQYAVFVCWSSLPSTPFVSEEVILLRAEIPLFIFLSLFIPLIIVVK